VINNVEQSHCRRDLFQGAEEQGCRTYWCVVYTTSSRTYDASDFSAGGANGIGASTVRYLAHAGARVVFGDFDKQAGEKLAESFSSEAAPPVFVEVDVSRYGDNLKLFRTALDKYGQVDHAIACAGIVERGKWFDPDLTIETVEKPETERVIEINLLGTLYFARIAVVYLRHNRKDGEDKSLTLISSAAGFRDSPGLFLYQVPRSVPLLTNEIVLICWLVFQTRRTRSPPHSPKDHVGARPYPRQCHLSRDY